MACSSNSRWHGPIRALFSGTAQWPMITMLFAVAMLLYANTFQNDWNYDDFPVVVDNPDIRSLGSFFRDSYVGRPLRELSYLLDFQLFGTRPTGYHLQNVFWHAGNGCLVFVLALRLGFTRAAAWLAALFFLAHPLQVEVVASTAHRKDSLACFFMLLTLLIYSRFVSATRHRWLYGGLTVCSCLLALGAKQTAYVLPMLLLAYEFCLVPEGQRFLSKSPRLIGAVAAVAGLGAAVWVFLNGGWQRYLAAAQGHLARQNCFVEDASDIVLNHLAIMLKAWTFLLSKLVWPTGLALEYTFAHPSSPADPWLLAAALLLAAYAVCVIWAWRRRERALLFSLLFAGFTWLPTSNLWPLSYYAADRYLYLPSIGIFFCAVWFSTRIFARRQVVASIAAGCCLMTLGILTFKQNQVWRTSETLWRHAVEVNPTSAYALNNMGMVNYEAGNLQKAFQYFQESAKVNPLNAEALYNLGFLSERFGEQQQALNYYRRFLKLKEPHLEGQRSELRRHLFSRYGVTD